MNSETDVLEFDFPDYEEPYPPFPDVKIELFDKEDSYSRNRDIADKHYAGEKQIAEKKQTARKARRREIKTRKTIAILAGLILSAVLAAAAINFIKNWDEPTTSTSDALKEYILEQKLEENFFNSAAEIVPLLEKIEAPEHLPNFHAGAYTVIINFTVKNTSDKEISFMPSRFYAKLKNGSVLPPGIPDSENFSHNDSIRVPAGEQVSFSVLYLVSEKNSSEIKCFAYKINSERYKDIADTDGYVSRLIESEIEKY